MLTHFFRFALLAIALMIFACGDDEQPRVCTEIGCTSGFTVRFDEPILLKGEQRLLIELDLSGSTRRCELRAGETPMVSENCGAMTFHWDGERLEEFIVHDADPENVGVRVRRDQETLHQGEFALNYQEVQPNGPGCPPICRQALLQL